MLLIDQISNDKEKTLKGLEKRGFKNLGVIDEIIELNNIRKKTQQKLDQIIIDLEINKTKLMIDMGKDEIDNTVKLSSFLAMGSGARGTPALFINLQI